ncbi:MAG: hypothetical protein HGB23_11670 [Chlorobiaceae bacterium]|nr:hypothetical protein [Chlorobiaceae bacterium]
MKKVRPFLSRLLLLMLLTASINGQFSSAHAVQTTLAAAITGEEFVMLPAMQREKNSTNEHHKHTGECHTCGNCLCHVILPVQSLKLDYNPAVISFCTFKPIANLPEVTLSRFIPPRTA